MKTLLLSLLVVGLVACSPEPVGNAPKVGDDIPLPEMVWKVRDLDHIKAVYEASGRSLGEKQEILGLAGTDMDTGQWIVMTPPPRTVDDAVTCSLGHEVLHVALGDYHR